MKKAKLDFDSAKATEGASVQFEKAVPLRSVFTSLLSSIAVTGACVLLGVIYRSIVFKLILNSLWKVGSELLGVKLCMFP